MGFEPTTSSLGNPGEIKPKSPEGLLLIGCYGKCESFASTSENSQELASEFRILRSTSVDCLGPSSSVGLDRPLAGTYGCDPPGDVDMRRNSRRPIGYVARAVLGDRSPQVTELYAELDLARAAEAMAKMG
jgi:hypothetical protein